MAKLGFLEEILLPLAEKLGTNRYLVALKSGFIYTLPLIIVGSIILLLVNLPFADPIRAPQLYMEWYANLMDKYKSDLLQPYYVSMGAMALFVSFGIGSKLSESFGISGVRGGFISIFTFLILGAQVSSLPVLSLVGLPFMDVAEGNNLLVMDARYLSSKGLFTAMFSAIFSVHVYKFMIDKGIVIRMPKSVPPSVARSFEVILPIFALAILAQGLNLILRSTVEADFPLLLLKAFQPLIALASSYWGLVFIVVLIHLFWFVGIHSSGIFSPIILTVTLGNLDVNMGDVAAGKDPSQIFAGGFLDNWVYLGGAGATIGLAIAMAFFSKNEQSKSLGRLSLIPAMFNINEPIIFGTPIVMNPVLGIPFIITPLINLTITYFASSMDWIGKVTVQLPWTTPSPLAALISTGFNIPSLILSLSLTVLSVLIYLPFLKIYERSLSSSDNDLQKETVET